ncbi:MAG: YcgL domain-containing protein [Motiliproteus sp.]
MKLICQVFKSLKKSEMYLYVDKKEGLGRVPEALLEVFGQPQPAMVLLITPNKKLARVDTEKLLSEIGSNGYYLQMPPATEPYKLNLYSAPTDARY